jgi:hypothetical protein
VDILVHTDVSPNGLQVAFTIARLDELLHTARGLLRDLVQEWSQTQDFNIPVALGQASQELHEIGPALPQVDALADAGIPY